MTRRKYRSFPPIRCLFAPANFGRECSENTRPYCHKFGGVSDSSAQAWTISEKALYPLVSRHFFMTSGISRDSSTSLEDSPIDVLSQLSELIHRHV